MVKAVNLQELVLLVQILWLLPPTAVPITVQEMLVPIQMEEEVWPHLIAERQWFAWNPIVRLRP